LLRVAFAAGSAIRPHRLRNLGHGLGCVVALAGRSAKAIIPTKCFARSTTGRRLILESTIFSSTGHVVVLNNTIEPVRSTPRLPGTKVILSSGHRTNNDVAIRYPAHELLSVADGQSAHV
jgi:hypothetical protein